MSIGTTTRSSTTASSTAAAWTPTTTSTTVLYTKITGTVLMTISDPAFVSSPTMATAVAQSLALLVHVPSDYTIVTLALLDSRRLAGQAGGSSMRVSYTIAAPASAGMDVGGVVAALEDPAATSSLTSNLQTLLMSALGPDAPTIAVTSLSKPSVQIPTPEGLTTTSGQTTTTGQPITKLVTTTMTGTSTTSTSITSSMTTATTTTSVTTTMTTTSTTRTSTTSSTITPTTTTSTKSTTSSRTTSTRTTTKKVTTSVTSKTITSSTSTTTSATSRRSSTSTSSWATASLATTPTAITTATSVNLTSTTSMPTTTSVTSTTSMATPTNTSATTTASSFTLTSSTATSTTSSGTRSSTTTTTTTSTTTTWSSTTATSTATGTATTTSTTVLYTKISGSVLMTISDPAFVGKPVMAAAMAQSLALLLQVPSAYTKVTVTLAGSRRLFLEKAGPRTPTSAAGRMLAGVTARVDFAIEMPSNAPAVVSSDVGSIVAAIQAPTAKSSLTSILQGLLVTMKGSDAPTVEVTGMSPPSVQLPTPDVPTTTTVRPSDVVMPAKLATDSTGDTAASALVPTVVASIVGLFMLGLAGFFRVRLRREDPLAVDEDDCWDKDDDDVESLDSTCDGSKQGVRRSSVHLIMDGDLLNIMPVEEEDEDEVFNLDSWCREQESMKPMAHLILTLDGDVEVESAEDDDDADSADGMIARLGQDEIESDVERLEALCAQRGQEILSMDAMPKAHQAPLSPRRLQQTEYLHVAAPGQHEAPEAAERLREAAAEGSEDEDEVVCLDALCLQLQEASSSAPAGSPAAQPRPPATGGRARLWAEEIPQELISMDKYSKELQAAGVGLAENSEDEPEVVCLDAVCAQFQEKLEAAGVGLAEDSEDEAEVVSLDAICAKFAQDADELAGI